METARVNIEPESSNIPGGNPADPSAEAAASQPQSSPAPEMSAAETIVSRAEASTSQPEAVATDEVEEEIEIEEEEADLPFAEPLEFIDETADLGDLKYEWFILKVQVNREDSIK